MAAVEHPAVHAVTLKDGRTLAYSFLGAPWKRSVGASAAATGAAAISAAAAGAAAASAAAADCSASSGGASPTQQKCILYLHGYASCRLEAGLVHSHAAFYGLSVVAINRPGAGQSTFNPNQTVEGMAEDARELLDALELDKVIVMGVSGGSPFACAVAALLPERVEALLLVCPLMPTAGREEQLLPGHSPSSLRMREGITRHPWRLWASLHALRLIQRLPHGNLLLRMSGFSEVDLQACLEAPHLAAGMKAGVREGLRQGVAGAMRDLQIYYVEPPTTDLAAIRCPTHIWQGGADSTTPPAMAQHLAAAIPGAVLHLLEGEGHLSLPFKHSRAILGSVAG